MAEWQTRKVESLVVATPYWFKSSLPDHIFHQDSGEYADYPYDNYRDLAEELGWGDWFEDEDAYEDDWDPDEEIPNEDCNDGE